ncbi:bifunctional 4-hydroxy-2-oxoglutarate aldolase/2-dehydro-3-deoxy-phosphogluconate aldolase [Mucilaginibacter sp.]|uniref:bifunctional 4-hydroxy-2-oxoglutarate aldolase/2-dehydro-3-deoxy-phosphogluconate aldolase n=1 Tax=Mucilaginibacter sp. TaxID=1882438 RepID=UPI00283BB5F7|nr:bifunctional 4-hydroxy-2-oxoglutarate aldolase/2-dehydro-3-deoxy-phosphogluconate aldolase [Mucilaginibacter sp.]MDR3693585.1 bifunctional 4-hydroxy-2-oxoglutarate aldolase/2-dehydro-3-deoxy-phosphogluconate aldolase [Mucilaginibacter sp.]
MNKTFSFDLFNQMPVVGIMRNIPDEHIEAIAGVYCRSGLTNLEITMNSPNAEQNIALLADLYGDELNIGAGTVCSMTDLEKALKAKSQFIVTPIINEEVIRTCVAEKVPIFPGAYTPSEIYKAWSLGASMIKLFPAGDLKPGYIKEILAPLSFVSLMPTGGVTLDNFMQYFHQGAKGVGVGSQLFPKDIINKQDWQALAGVYVSFVNKYRDFITGKK